MRTRYVILTIVTLFVFQSITFQEAIGREQEWKDYSLSFISAKPGTIPDQGISSHYLRNLRIRRAYTNIYLSNPEAFKWAGLATIAVRDIGHNIAQAAGSDSTFHQIAYAIARKAGWLDPSLDVIILANVTANFLGSGNYYVYKDLYWQHLFASECGYDALLRYTSMADLPKSGWREIPEGTRQKDQSKIWSGNAKLLQYEQSIVLEKYVFNANSWLWTQLTSFDREKLTLFRVGSGITFSSVNPSGDFGRFEDRWRWIEKAVLEPAKKLDLLKPIHGPGPGKSMVDQVSKDLNDVMGEIQRYETAQSIPTLSPIQKPACPGKEPPPAPQGLRIGS